METTQQAAQALTPVAGPLAVDVFAAGLLASAILSVPVLAATTACILGEESSGGGGGCRSRCGRHGASTWRWVW